VFIFLPNGLWSQGPITESPWYHVTIFQGRDMVHMVAVTASTMGYGGNIVEIW